METIPDSIAYLSCKGGYAVFTFRDKAVRFYVGPNIVCFTGIREWDNGYLVVTCRRKSAPEMDSEDYIDLNDILKKLYISPTAFLRPIKKVMVRADE